MKVTTERLENCQVNVFIELDAADVDKKLRQTARKISRQFNMPGYRRGRAPFHAVVRIFGREALQHEALEDFGNDLYEQALEEIEYEPYEIGSLEEVEWDPFRMTVLLPIPPEVDLGDYRSVRVPLEAEDVTNEQIDEYLAGVQEEYSQWVPIERPAAVDDQIVLDIVSKIGDNEVMNDEEFEMILEAGGAYPAPGFHDEIVGVSAGEDKTFTLVYAEDDPDENAAGQEGTITIHLHSVKEKDVPPLDDELAMMVGDYDTLEDLKASVQERFETEAQQKAESEYLDKVLDAMIESAAQIEYPPQALDREAEMALDQMERSLAGSGLQLDTYLGMMGTTRDAYKQELGPMVQERLQKRLVLNEIAEQEQFKIEEDEIEAELERMRETLGPEAEQMMEMLDSPGGRLMVASDLITAKAQERVTQIGKGEAPPLEEEEKSEPEADTEADVRAEAEPEAVEEEAAAEAPPEPEQDADEPEPTEAPAEEANAEEPSEAEEPAEVEEPESDESD